MNNWIRVDVDLARKPKLVALAETLGDADRFRVVGQLVALWGWVQQYGTRTNLRAETIDAAIGLPSGFVAAVVRVGWADIDGDGIAFRFAGTTMPELAAVRSQAGARGAAKRWQRDSNAIANASQSEIERESDIQPTEIASAISSPGADATPATGKRRERKPRLPSVVWDESSGFAGVTDSMRNAWRVAAPLADIDAELSRAHVWLVGQPAARRKRDYRRFLANWFLRVQERLASGGTGGYKSRASLPFGCRRDADGIVRTPSGAALEGFE